MDFNEIYCKAAVYCGRGEHCRSQIVEKLILWNAPPDWRVAILEKLEQESFLDETRYATIFARSKLNQNGWGRHKIIYALRANKVNEESIRIGVNALDEPLYLETLEKIIQKAERSIKESNPVLRKKKIIAHAASKGFEMELICGFFEKNKLPSN